MRTSYSFNEIKKNSFVDFFKNLKRGRTSDFLFCYERDFILSLSDNNQADIIEAFNSTSRYLDGLLNIDNPYLNKW